MWTFEHTITSRAKLETIWSLYSDISTWLEWDKGMVHASLNGPFAAGTCGFLQPAGKPQLEFQLLEVEPLRGFSDVTQLSEAGIEVRFSHRLEPIVDGTSMTHHVTIAGPNADKLGPEFGAHLTGGIPILLTKD